MNKIEEAISDCKLNLENLYRERIILLAKIKTYQDSLATLEKALKLKDDSIPNEEKRR
jgi:hypothetical protein